jgi:hypothetical protein
VMHVSPPRGVAVAKTEDQAWRGRTLLACSLMAGGVIALGAANLDWSEGLDMALGQIAGLVAPLVVLGLIVWAGATFVGKNR